MHRVFRCADFLVHEIDQSGRVVSVSSVEVPKDSTNEHSVDLTDKNESEQSSIHIAALATAGVSTATATRFLEWVKIELEKNQKRKDRRSGRANKREARAAAAAVAGDEKDKTAPPTNAQAAPSAAAVTNKSADGDTAMTDAAPPASGSGGSGGAAVNDQSEQTEPAEQTEQTERSKLIAQPFQFDAEPDKTKRSLMHKIIRAHWDGQIVTDAVPHATDKSVVCIQAMMAQAAKGMNKRSDRWVEGRPHYLRFALYKQNIDTMEAVRALSSTMKCAPNLFSYAGTKDRRGITTQLITAYKVNASKIASVIAQRFANVMKAGNYEYVPNQLKLGDLKGNRSVLLCIRTAPACFLLCLCNVWSGLVWWSGLVCV